MVVTAIAKKMKITEVNLGEKIHGISYHKMLDIFECVLRGFTETYKCYPMRLKKQDISYKALEIKNNKWQYLEPFKEKYIDHLEDRSYYNYEKMRKDWLNILNIYINSLPNVSEVLITKMKKTFINYCLSFWYYVDKNNNTLWENIIVDNSLQLGGKNGITN